MKRLLTFFLLFCLHFKAFSQDVKTFIPPRAFDYIPTVKSEVYRLMPDIVYPHYFGALIEHESCLSFKHSRCWSPTSELRSKREQGSGLGQITRTYREDGSIRFDSLTDMKRAHLEELKEWSWENVTQRPDLQIRAIVLMTRDNIKALHEVKDDVEQLKMADAAYNGGLRDLKKERLVCGLKTDCDPQIWFDNVEKQCVKSTEAIYGKRSPCDINRHHVKDVLKVRLNKYSPHFNLGELQLISLEPTSNIGNLSAAEPSSIQVEQKVIQPVVPKPIEKPSEPKKSEGTLGKISTFHYLTLGGVILMILGAVFGKK